MATQPSFIRPDEFWQLVGLRADQTVVHLGCGAGFYLIPAAKLVGPKGRVIGIDVREDMLQEAESRAAREQVADSVETIRTNLEDHPQDRVPAAVADWTLVANILYQANPQKILAEARRVTKPAGTVIVVEWQTAATPLGPPAQQRLSARQISAIATGQGLLSSGTFIPSPYHFGLFFKRTP